MGKIIPLIGLMPFIIGWVIFTLVRGAISLNKEKKQGRLK